MTTVAMPCAARAALSEFAADAKALLVMMTRFAALDVAFQVEGSFQWIAAGGITRASAKAKIVRGAGLGGGGRGWGGDGSRAGGTACPRPGGKEGALLSAQWGGEKRSRSDSS